MISISAGVFLTLKAIIIIASLIIHFFQGRFLKGVWFTSLLYVLLFTGIDELLILLPFLALINFIFSPPLIVLGIITVIYWILWIIVLYFIWRYT